MSDKETAPSIPQLALEIRTLAHRGWEHLPNTEVLFRAIGERAQQISELAVECTAPAPQPVFNHDQIKYMVNRFLAWKLPENFNPDGGISFKRNFNEKTPWPMKNEPVGTNLFDATQTEEMIRYLVDGLPEAAATPQVTRRFSARYGRCDAEWKEHRKPHLDSTECRNWKSLAEGTSEQAPQVKELPLEQLKEIVETPIEEEWDASEQASPTPTKD